MIPCGTMRLNHENMNATVPARLCHADAVTAFIKINLGRAMPRSNMGVIYGQLGLQFVGCI